MLLARPADQYAFLKESYLLAPIRTRPDLVGLKAQMRDIDAEFQKSNSTSGQKGHIKPNCAKKDEKCGKCGKLGHLQSMCKAASERASGSGDNNDAHKKAPEAAQLDSFYGFRCEVIIGTSSPEAMIVEVDLADEAS